MRKISPPQMFILLEVLFPITAVLLVVLALLQSPGIKIKLDNLITLKDIVVAGTDKNKQIKHWFNFKTNTWEKVENFPKLDRRYNFTIGNIECDKYDFCAQVPPL